MDNGRNGEGAPTRDKLASIRSHLANERTLLAYVRTSLAFLAAGSGLILFLTSFLASFVGWAFIGAGVVMIAIGAKRFLRFRKCINSVGS